MDEPATGVCGRIGRLAKAPGGNVNRNSARGKFECIDFLGGESVCDVCPPSTFAAGYGYPQLTGQAKRKILGENLLRLHGMDVADARSRLGRTRT
jgi:hypothetical protein